MRPSTSKTISNTKLAHGGVHSYQTGRYGSRAWRKVNARNRRMAKRKAARRK